jgi:anti-sigma factor RsiW
VRDLANEGFGLIGGRLDTLGGRRMATLVYRHRQHTIVARAKGSGMDWLAVSDVNPDESAAFLHRLAARE